MIDQENKCCPMLRVIPCAVTKEHKHLYCDYLVTIEYLLMTDGYVKEYCIGEFKDCLYYPKGE